ncbi:MAG: HAMP domain-containing sensor histidine kinase [Candidatus Omnitrophota bacterium]
MEDMDYLKRFSGKVAHDFNNVLTGVLGFAQLILMDMGKDDKFYEDVKQIENAAKKGRTFTDQLLLFSQKRPLVKKDEDVNEIIKDSLEEVRDMVKKDVVITTDLNKAPFLNLDGERIGQALKGVIMNSNEAIDSGGEIRLSTAVSDEGKNVLISVEDDGKGATPKDLPFIFEPFYKTEKMRENGVGLTIAYEIVKEHGGQIEALLREGGGMIFKMRFPV